MKRLISLLLALFITIGINPVFNNVFATNTIDFEDVEVKDAFAILSLINVFPDSEAGESAFTKPVSRIEFATYAAALMGVNVYDTSNVSYYKDIPDDHWGKTSVNALTEKGIFSGNGDAMFYPDDNITMEQACKVLMTIVGYDKIAIVKGGYPAGYLAVANSNKIIPDVASHDSLTLRDIALLLYNTINMPYNEPVVFGDEYTEYSRNEYDTFLSLYHNIHIAEGQLTAVGSMSLSSNTETQEGEVCIDGNIFKCDLDMEEYLGMQIKVYYKKGMHDDTRKVVYKCENYNESEVLVIPSENLVSFDEITGAVTYYSNIDDKRASIKHVAKNASVIYNGRAASNDLKKALSVTNGKVKLIQSNGSKYDVVIAEQYSYINIGKVDATKSVIYDDYDNTLSLDLNNVSGDRYIKILSTSGVIQEFSALKAGDVVQYLESADKKYVRAYVCTNKVSGIVIGFSEKEGNNIVKIGEDEYIISKIFEEKSNLFFHSGYTNNAQKKLELGDTATFVLDLNGRVVGASFGEAEVMKCGFLINIADVSLFDDEISFKIFTQDGKMCYYRSAEKIIVDGSSYEKATDIMNAIRTEDGVYYQAVRYMLDENEKIREIDTVKRGEKETDYSLTHTNKGESNLSYSWVGLLGLKNFITSTGTVVIQVPEKKNILTAGDDEFVVTGKSAFKDREPAVADIYKFNPDVLTADLVITYKAFSPDINYASGLMLVDEVSQAIGSDGMVADCISGLHNGVYTTIYISDNYNASDFEDSVDVSKIGSGDVIVFATNLTGEAIRIRMVCDYSIAEKNEPNNMFFDNNAMNPNYSKTRDEYYSDFINRYRISYGYVNRIVGNHLTWSYNELGKNDEIYDVTVNSNLAKIMIYDKNKRTEKVFLGTLNDVTSYENSSDSYSKIITMAQNGQVYAIVFYI